MANTPTPAEHAAATAANRAAYDAIHGTNAAGGVAGSETVLERVKKKYDSDSKKYAAEYKAALAKYNADVAAYKKTQDAKNVMTKALKAVETASTAVKTKDSLTKAYASAINKLTTAAALAPTKGQDQLQTAYDAAAAAFNALKKAGGNPAPLPKIANVQTSTNTSGNTSSAVYSATDFMANYTVGSDGTVTGPNDKGVQTQVFLVPVKNAQGKETLQPFSSAPSARDAYLKGYTTAQLATLKKDLVAKKFLTSKELASGDWLMGVDRMLFDYTANAVKSVKYEGAKNTPSIAAWFKTSSATGGSGSGTVASKAGTETTAYLDLTTVGDANKEINDYMMDNLGIEATAEQKAAYYTDIHNRELASTRSVKNVKDAQGNTISSTGTGAPVTQAERDSVMSGFVIQALSVADPKTLLASTKGSKVATDITALRSTALDYGMALTDTELLRYVKEGFGQTDYLKKTQDRIRQLAITTMPNLAAHIQGGGTVRDVADRYAAYKQQKLGVMVGDSIADKSIMDAINNPKGLLSISDWNRQMQADPLWGKTEEAMGIGTDFIKHFMQSFGMVG